MPVVFFIVTTVPNIIAIKIVLICPFVSYIKSGFYDGFRELFKTFSAYREQ